LRDNNALYYVLLRISTDIRMRKSPSIQAIAPVVLPNGSEPTPLGSGTITRLIGRGGMAAVYEIWNQQLEIYRAVKIIYAGSADLFQSRFQTEIKISAKLKHPNIIEIYGVGEWSGLPFIEMEKIDGIGLDQILAQHGALPSVACTSVAIMICKALHYAHTQDYAIYGKNYHGVIHRDLKPLNIMVCGNGVVKLMDFGIARPVDVSFQTMDGMVSGTLQYLSPEQLEKKKLDERSDLYSLGVTMYEIVTGVNPFPQTNFAHLIANKSKNKFKPIEAHGIIVNNRLKKLIYKCMQHDPRKRVASAAELMRDLEKIHWSLTNKSPEDALGEAVSATGHGEILRMPRPRISRFAWAFILLFAALAFFAVRYHPRFTSFFARWQPPARLQTIHQAGGESGGPRQNTAQSPPPDDSAKPPRSPTDQPPKKAGPEDYVAMMEKESMAKHYQTVLRLFERLTALQAKSPQALILKLRALDKTANRNVYAGFIRSVSINDGEFYLAKARLAFEKHDYEECKKLLSQSLSLPHVLMDYESLKLETSYYSALCSTALFDADPLEKTYKESLDAWWQLRSMLRNTPDHPYNKKAIGEIQRMGMKMQNTPVTGE
jgi:Protein kinase domain